MSLEIFQVDAFADRPYVGNPAAVVPLSGPRDPEWMQAVAREMNLSETAFLFPNGDAFNLRWFTPAVEIELCGHATLASAHVLWESGRLPLSKMARFDTLSGRLTAERVGEWIELDFPAKPAAETPDAPPELAAALGAAPRFLGKSRFDYLLEVATAEEVRTLSPDFSRLRTLPARGIIVTARGDGAPYDFVSRFFAPGSGIDEDPVTGSAHCTLAPYWAERLGKDEMLAYQASPRGGVVRVRLAGDRVKLGGQAVTVLAGRLLA